MQVTYGLLVGEDDGLVLSNDLPPEVLPAWRQLTQLFQLAHSESHTCINTQGIQRGLLCSTFR